MDANQLRTSFTSFFADRGHVVVPSASLIPHDPDLLFTVAGMVPFKPYFLGDEQAPHSRITTVQKCVRAGGKQNDLDEVGRTARHLSFFEMLGNFSFGDYFKTEAIPMAWDLITELFGLDPDILWVTCHTSDDEAAEIWHDAVGVKSARIQRMGEDNWWGPPGGPTGPCGPCSEIYVDKGDRYGEAGGPLHGSDERFLEIWNLVFMQFNRQADGVDVELPRKNIDTGAGLERILSVLQGVDSVYETDALLPLVEAAQQVTGVRLHQDPRSDTSLRILAEHARTMTFLVSDGVFPSNEDRGYVLRRIIRRAVRHAYLLGVDKPVTPTLVATTVEVMGSAYPDLVANQDFVTEVVEREEASFRQTLKSGSALLDHELAVLGSGYGGGSGSGAGNGDGTGYGGGTLAGSVAFKLHDTFGFPLEVTQEIAIERGVVVDIEGFEREMDEQRTRAKAARKAAGAEVAIEIYRELVDASGVTEFTGREENETQAKVLAVIPLADGIVEVILDCSPFYAESGGQVGDTGLIVSPAGRLEVLDTTYALPGLQRHLGRIVEGEISVGQEVTASIDVERRAAIRRNHTGTHLLHWALGEVLGGHVKQQGSLVGPDYLRFDFSHYDAMSPQEIAAVEDLANSEVLANDPVRHFETTKNEAVEMGAIAFFGDKYGDVVRVLEAGRHSLELCGGTHVNALGDIGPIKIISEGSIGANQRRIMATTGHKTIERFARQEAQLNRAASLVGVGPDELVEGLTQRLEELKNLREELRLLKRQAAGSGAGTIAAQAIDGVVVMRSDGLDREAVRDLAIAIRDQPAIRAAIVGSEPDGGGVVLVAAVSKESGFNASELIADAARTVQGGGGKSADIAMAGGKDASRLDEALDQVRVACGLDPLGSVASEGSVASGPALRSEASS